MNRREVVLDSDDVEVLLTVHGLRDNDEDYVRPGQVFEFLAPQPRRNMPTVQKVAAKMRDLAERGALERRNTKTTMYREEVGVIAAIDRGYGEGRSWWQDAAASNPPRETGQR